MEIPTGCLVGRTLEQIRPGPWWTRIAIVTRLDEARPASLELAAAGVKAWLQEDANAYEPLETERPGQ
jgi:hypothetical protein